MGDDGKKMDTALLMHVFGMAKKGGMRNEMVEELLDVVREQAKINEKNVELQTAAMQPNPPYDLKSLGLNHPQGSNAALFTQMMKDASREGWKADGDWDCFIEYGGRGGHTIDDECQEAQKIADDQEVPVRLNFNDTFCILYPNGKWKEGLESWWETRQELDRSRSQAKTTNFSVAPTMITMNYAKADADATRLMFHVLKSRTPPLVDDKPENMHSALPDPEHFFKGLRDFLGDDD